MSFIYFGTRSFATATTNKAVFGNGASSGTDNGSRQWLPRRTTMKDLTLTCAFNPNGAYTYQVKNNGVTVGPAISLNDGTTNLRTAMLSGGVNIVFPAAVGSSSANPLLYNIGFSANQQINPPSQDINECFSYVCDAPDDNICFVTANDDASNITLDPTARFTTFGWAGVGASTTVESVAQIGWPITGTFQYLVVGSAASGTTATTYDLVLRINAVDTGIKVSVQNGITDVKTNFANTASVNAGDLVDFRYQRTAGADTNAQPAIVLGFRSLIT